MALRLNCDPAGASGHLQGCRIVAPRLPVRRWPSRSNGSRSAAAARVLVDREDAKVEDGKLLTWPSLWLESKNITSEELQAEDANGCVLHFAYGANLAYEVLARRDVKVMSRDAAFVRDPRLKVVFKHRGGYATLERQPEEGLRTKFMAANAYAHGVLYKLTQQDMEKLKKKEGGYMVEEIEVQTYDGKVQRAQAFVSAPLAKLYDEVHPTEQYMRLLRDGAADNYLEPHYQAWLSGIETRTNAGLGYEYYNTPSKYVAYSFLAVVGLVVAAFCLQQ